MWRSSDPRDRADGSKEVSWRCTPKSCPLAKRFTYREGSEERVLALHIEELAAREEIHESVSDVVVY